MSYFLQFVVRRDFLYFPLCVFAVRKRSLNMITAIAVKGAEVQVCTYRMLDGSTHGTGIS